MNSLLRRYYRMLYWNRWLSYEACIAIYTAFGMTDGLKVITATNAYLNQLAASDRDKATALAGFINQYPTTAKYLTDHLEAFDNLAGGDHSLYFAYNTGGSLGVKMENDTTYRVRYIKSTENKQYCHILGTSKTLGNTPRLWIGIDDVPNLEERTGQLVTDSSTDYASWRDLMCAKLVLFDDNVCQFSGWIFYITAEKNGVYTHYWLPMQNGKFIDIMTGQVTTWAVSYRANYPL